MNAKELRAIARSALRGHWAVAVAVGLVGGLLTGATSFTASSGSGEASGYLDFGNHQLWIVLLTVAVATVLISLVIGGVVQMGWCSFHIKLVKRQEVRFGDLFSYFHQLWRGFCMTVVMGFFTILWTLLFIIPGIIAAYRYAMVPFLMAEFPDLGVMDAMRESKRLMQGNKWRLFCLDMSFIGWALLASLSFGIGSLWLVPYVKTAVAAFYMDVTGRGQLLYEPEPTRPTGYGNNGSAY